MTDRAGRIDHSDDGRDEDDDALTWAGDRDRTHVEAPVERETVVDELPDEDAAPRTSSLLLVVYGVLAGVYLLYTVGWITSVTRTTLPVYDLLSGILYQFGQFLAIASPALWLAATVLLTRDRKPVVRLLWVVLGLVVVAPWPFLLGR
jgi:hypothetical protein